MNRRLAAGVVLVLVLSGCGSGGSEDGPARHPGVRSDFDGDGYGDLVVGDTGATVDGKYAAGYAAVLPGSAKGPENTGKPRVVTQNSLGLGKAGEGGGFGSAGASVTADLDGDGRADFVTQAGRSTIFVVWGSDKGLSGDAAARLPGAAPLTGDVDGDGHADLVVSGSEENTVRVLLGPFSRKGAPRGSVSLDLTPSDPAYPRAVPAALGDVTGDGKDDLLVSWAFLADEAPVARATVLYRGAAGGKLAEGQRWKDFYGTALSVGDVNKDGYADVVAELACEMRGDPFPPEGGSRVEVLYGGTFQTTRITEETAGLPVQGPFSYCSFGSGPEVGDVDGDGYADVAFSAETEKRKSVGILLHGSARGLTVTGAQSVPAGAALMLDTDGDRADELIIQDLGAVQVLRGGPDGVGTSPMLTVHGANLDLGPDITGTGRGFRPVG
ncbi:VCBS repeat-containing protein [Streptomyces sp. SID13726]|uniref:FG-GAP repeat domain-containing protein n=1 Tax=Streptomyces sp. SID13726 TaxID=2706058 RepID=UPI0013BC8095|nr:VCBS repeat-containing protein [Streptomyces sp. SID13726]NEB05924.1 VCBS repeat-containing protein [Streptomyces sp. SID13726]